MATSEDQNASGEQRLDQIVAAYLEAREQGAAPDPDAWVNAHPEFGAELREFLSNWDGVSALGNKLLSLPALVPPPVFGPPALTELGDFRILRELGHGGMGIVYEAEQVSLRRRVALKVLPQASLLDERLLRRFRHEAAAVANLHHPSIVPIYAVGAERGINFFAMQLIEGGNVAQAIAERRARATRQPSSTDLSADPLPGSTTPSHGRSANSASTIAGAENTLSSKAGRDYYRAVARLGIEVAEALDCAHQCGVIHRDIKPSNLLLDKDGHVWVSDFGLALTQDNATLTTTGGLVGTMPYMSPEQASGNRAAIDHRSDVYGLGMTLYELVTLRTAFVAEDRQGLLRQILDAEPPSPHRFDKRVPTDLETILLSAIAKNPTDRYVSAKDLADDLRRFLELKPIQRKRIGRWGRFTRWCRRSPVVAGLSAATLLILIAATAISASLAVAWRSKSLEAENHRREAVVRQAALENGVYNLQLSKIASVVETDLVAAERMLEDPERCPVRLRDFTWGHFQQLCRRDRLTLHGHDGEVFQTACAPDGGMLLSCGYDGTVRLWDTETGAELHRFVGHVGPVRTVAFSPDDPSLAVSGGDDGYVRFWDLKLREPFGALEGHTGRVRHVAFSADGTRLASVGDDLVARIWDVATRSVVARIEVPMTRNGTYLSACSFSPDGNLLAFGGQADGIQLWDPTGKSPFARTSEGPSRTTRLTFSNHGQRILATGMGNRDGVMARRAPGLELDTTWQMQLPFPTSCHAVSPDGKTLAISGNQGIVRLWDTESGALRLQFSTQQELEASWLTFSPDGRELFVSSHDGTIKAWQLHATPTSSEWALVEYSRCGRLVAMESETKGLELRDAADGRLISTLALAPDDEALGIDFSPDAKHCVTAMADGSARIWEVASGRLARRLEGHSDRVRKAYFSPDGRLIASAGRDHTIRIWEADTGRLRFTLRHENRLWDLAFLPDGRSLVSTAEDQTIRIWDVERGRQITLLPRTGRTCNCLAVSPDGRLLAAGHESPGNEIEIWNLASQTLIAAAAGHRDGIQRIDFSPDGKKLASTSLDHTVRLWDPVTGELRTILSEAAGRKDVLRFSPDGRLLSGAGNDGRWLQWRVAESRHAGVLRAYLAHGVSTCWGPHCEYWAALTAGNQLEVRHAGDNQPIWRTRLDAGAVTAMFVSPTGESVAIATPSGDVSVQGQSQPAMQLQAGHAVMRALHFSADGTTLVGGGDEGVAHLWDVRTGSRRELRHSGEGRILALALSADGSTLVSGGEDQLARVYQLGSDDPPTLLHGAGAPITALDVADNGTAIAAGCCDGRVWLWDHRNSRPRQVLGPQPSPCCLVRFSPSGNQLAIVDLRRIITLVDSMSTQMQVRICGHAEASSVAFAFSGDRLWSASAEPRPLLKCWSAKAGQPLAQLAGHTKSVYGMAFSPDGKWLVSIGNDGLAVIWDVAQRQLRHKVHASTTYLRHMALDRHSRVLATSGPDGVKLWDLTSGNHLGLLDQVGVAEDGLAFSPTDDLLCVARDASVYFCEPHREGKQFELQTALGTIVSMAFSPDGRRLALNHATGDTSIIDVATRQTTVSWPSHAYGSSRIAWSPSGQIVATTAYNRDHAAVQVWNTLAQSKVHFESPWPSNGTGNVAFLPDGNRLAYCLKTNIRDVRMCSLATGRELLAFGSTFGAAASGELAISPDGSLLATNGPGDTIWLFDTELLRELPVDGHKDSTTEP